MLRTRLHGAAVGPTLSTSLARACPSGSEDAGRGYKSEDHVCRRRRRVYAFAVMAAGKQWYGSQGTKCESTAIVVAAQTWIPNTPRARLRAPSLCFACGLFCGIGCAAVRARACRQTQALSTALYCCTVQTTPPPRTFSISSFLHATLHNTVTGFHKERRGRERSHPCTMSVCPTRTRYRTHFLGTRRDQPSKVLNVQADSKVLLAYPLFPSTHRPVRPSALSCQPHRCSQRGTAVGAVPHWGRCRQGAPASKDGADPSWTGRCGLGPHHDGAGSPSAGPDTPRPQPGRQPLCRDATGHAFVSFFFDGEGGFTRACLWLQSAAARMYSTIAIVKSRRKACDVRFDELDGKQTDCKTGWRLRGTGFQLVRAQSEKLATGRGPLEGVMSASKMAVGRPRVTHALG